MSEEPEDEGEEEGDFLTGCFVFSLIGFLFLPLAAWILRTTYLILIGHHEIWNKP